MNQNGTAVAEKTQQTLAPNEQGSGFSKGRTSKVTQMGWSVHDAPGELEWIQKGLLFIDHNYQRNQISNSRVLDIARYWSWVACGTLIVARRADGTLWVIDGQHRKLASDKRADVQQLPCIVFQSTDIKEEARGYLRANTVRGPMKSAEKFTALVCAADEPALFVRSMVTESGYRVSKCRCEFGVVCVGELLRCVSVDRRIAKDCWQLAVDIHNGQFIRERVYLAFFYLERFLHAKYPGETITRGHNRESLMASGLDAIVAAINRSSAYYARGGARIWAEGVITLLNHKRRTRRIQSCVSSAVEE